MSQVESASHRFSVVLKPAGAACNLACEYCYYALSPAHRAQSGHWAYSAAMMSAATFEAFAADYLAGQPAGEVTFLFQGGEPTLRGLEFYEFAVACVGRHLQPGQRPAFALQTNATLIDRRWAEFLAVHQFLVGVSIDGPARLHDRFRVNRGGRPSFALVRRGWEMLAAHGVATNALCTVNSANQDHPLEVYRFLRDELGAQFIQFIPVVEPRGDQVSAASVRPAAYGRFLTAVFDEWLARDVGTVYVGSFEEMLAARLGRYLACATAPSCGTCLALEASGELYMCDHYVREGYELGVVTDDPVTELAGSARAWAFGQAKAEQPRACRDCPVQWACHGGCPKDRFVPASGGPNQYLCAGYRQFFTHAAPVVDDMARALRHD